jgi:hypothetical protein
MSVFKYELNQLVYYLKDNKIHSAPILSRCIVENLHDEWNSTHEQEEFFCKFGKSAILYITCHGFFSEDKIFNSKEDLCKTLMED